jgi:hypothetical protein
MANCCECSGDMGNGCRCKNIGAPFSVQCNYFTSNESYKDYSCEEAVEEIKNEQNKVDLEKAEEGMKFVDLGEDNEK